MIILSISVQSIEDISTLTAAIEACHRANHPSVVHIAGLSRLVGTFPDADPSEADRGNAALAALRNAVEETRSAVWAGGWSGLTQRHLSQDELEWDLTWSVTNPWDTGLTRLLGVAPECIFPLEIAVAQALALKGSRIAKKHPLCLGYPSSVPGGTAVPSGDSRRGGTSVPGGESGQSGASVPGGTSVPGGAAPDRATGTGHLVVFADGQWHTLPTIRFGENADGATGGGPDARIIHTAPAHVAAGDPSVFGESRETRSWRESLVETARLDEGAPDGVELPGYFTSGLPASRWADPEVMAGRARRRAARRPSRERTRTILAVEPAPAVPAKGSPDPFFNRELQGSVTGALRLDTETVGAVLLEGRLAGLTVAGAPLTPSVRSQGFFQTPETITYLETVNAAWFTGVHVRGVHETASLGGFATVETTLFAHDDVPGITLTHRVTVHRDFPAEVSRIALMETVIAEVHGAPSNVLSTGMTGAIAGSDGSTRECAIDVTAAGAYPWEWARDAVALRLDLPGTPVWIAAAHPGATVTAPFALGVRPTPSGLRLVWHPLGFALNPGDPFLRRGSWTVSYRITGTEAPILRVEDPVAGEIDGFTASP
jgi:hypothetical protein